MHGYDALDAKRFTELVPEDAERLVRELFDSERIDRFRDPRPEITGPPPPSGTGADFLFTPRSAPVRDRAAFEHAFQVEALTYDEVEAPLAISVKAGKKWRTDALDDAKSETEAEWAVDALADGGRFVLITTQSKATAAPAVRAKAAASAKKTSATKPKKAPPAKPPSGHDLEKELAKALHARLKRRDPNANDPSDRVHVVDQQALITYLQRTGATLSSGMRAKLGVPSFATLLTLEQWRTEHRDDRPEGDRAFVWDASRTDASRRIEEVLDSTADAAESRAAWVIAPPGIGKTRLVLETLLREPARARRVLAATSPGQALTAIDAGLFATYKNVLLVVDDCEPIEVDKLVARFRRADRSARMIVLTPRAYEGSIDTVLEPIPIRPLDVAKVRELLANLLAAEQADDLAELSEGYPRFALLVAKAVSKERAEPPGRDDLWRAVELAVDPSRTDVARRVAGLFALSLLGTDLREQSPEEEAKLARWLGLGSFADVTTAIQICHQRGLVRKPPNEVERYVTPAIVEREIVKRLLAPPPGMPPFDRTRFPASMNSALESLRVRAAELGWPKRDLVTLANPTLRGLVQADIARARDLRFSNVELRFAAKHAPQETVRRIREFVERTSTEDLREDRSTRQALLVGLRHALEEPGTFEDIEDASFRLAVAENQPKAENNATSLWASLFDTVVHTEPLERRLRALGARLEDSRPEARRTTLVALARLTADLSSRSFSANVKWLSSMARRTSSQEAVLQAWRWVFDWAAHPGEVGADEAADIVASHLWIAAREGLLPALEEGVARLAPTFPERARPKLFNSLHQILLRADVDGPTRDTAMRLLEAVAPASFEGRLRLALNMPRPLARWKDVLAPLAREAIEHPHHLEEQLAWLGTMKVPGTRVFGAVLGEHDHGEVALRALRSRLPVLRWFLSEYLAGRFASDATSTANLLAEFRAQREYDLVAETLCRIGLDTERAQWLAEDVPRLSSPVFEALWHATFDSPYAADLVVKALLDPKLPDGSRDAATVAGLVLSEAQFASAPGHWTAALRRAFERASKLPLREGYVVECWSHAAADLLGGGLVDVVAEGVADAFIENGTVVLPHAENLLVECAQRDGSACWRALRRVLESPQAKDLHRLNPAGLTNLLPPDAALAWIGRHEDRAMRLGRWLTYTSESPPALARALVAAFGADSDVGHLIESELSRPEGNARTSFSYADRAKNVQPWTHDRSPAVRALAQKVIATLSYLADTSAEHAARSEARQRRRRSG